MEVLSSIPVNSLNTCPKFTLWLVLIARLFFLIYSPDRTRRVEAIKLEIRRFRREIARLQKRCLELDFSGEWQFLLDHIANRISDVKFDLHKLRSINSGRCLLEFGVVGSIKLV